MNEVWLPVIGWEDIYEVSSLGRVRRVAPGRHTHVGFVLSPHDDGDGYLIVTLCNNKHTHTRRVHALVCRAFHGRPRWYRDKYGNAWRQEARHLNGVRDDNCADNLCWGTNVENAADKILHDTHVRGARHKLSKLTAREVREIRASTDTLVAVGARYGVHPTNVCQIKRRKNWAWLSEE